MRIDFVKMHGAGNDFAVFDAPVPGALLTPQRLRALADRRTGIGFDQMLLIEAPRDTQSAAYYRIFNGNGEEIGQCGNGARCIAALLKWRGLAREGTLTLESAAGLIRARVEAGEQISVDLGVPDFDPRSLPFDAPGLADYHVLEVPGRQLQIGVVSLGNPHAVLPVLSAEGAAVETLGPAIEQHPRFPSGVNVGFPEIVARDAVRLRVHERGTGETLSCGTGACAAVAVAARLGLLDASVRVGVRGGELQVKWAGAGTHIWLAGAAHTSFQGYIEI